jgi:hypothetical protein
MTHTTMLTSRSFLSSEPMIDESLSTRSRASALRMTYSHQVWDASNNSESVPFDDDSRPADSLFAIRDIFDIRKLGRL